jgi:hypothetical protein
MRASPAPVLDLKRIEDDDHHLSLYTRSRPLLAGRITNEMKFAKLQISRDGLLVRRITSKRNLER